MKKISVLVIMLLVFAGPVLAGCGHSGVSEKTLISVLPETITACEFDGEMIFQEVTDISVIKAEINDDYEYVECEITLKDDHLERIVYAQLYLTKYEVGGWQIDSWAPLADEMILAVAEPDEARIDSFMDGYGFSDISLSSTDTSRLLEGYYERIYTVRESHEYADFDGNAVYRAELVHFGADDDGCASYSWTDNADFTMVNTSWKVDGFWKGTEIDPEYGRPDKYEINIAGIDDDGNVNGSGRYYYPAFDGNEYLGRDGHYDYSGASAYYEGSSPSDASLTISIGYEAEGLRMDFSPDSLTVTASSLSGDQIFDYHRS